VLAKEHARIDPEVEESRVERIEDFETLEAMIPKFQLNDYENGPFVLTHNDLTVQNILVGISILGGLRRILMELVLITAWAGR
jgi:aminoglycoside phosphotransferase (APT) family kinase protein